MHWLLLYVVASYVLFAAWLFWINRKRYRTRSWNWNTMPELRSGWGDPTDFWYWLCAPVSGPVLLILCGSLWLVFARMDR
jgi:hypothetical protein